MDSNNAYDFLFVHTDSKTLGELEEIAGSQGWTYSSSRHGSEALDLIEGRFFRVLVAAQTLPDFSGLQILEWLKTQSFHPEVVILHSRDQGETVLSALKLGACDVLAEPFESREKVEKALLLALERAKLGQRLGSGGETETGLGGMIGMSPRMKSVFELIKSVSASPANVLIQGESGTGKELAARAIHELSPRRTHPFVVINCSAMPEPLLESELFGYVRGAFTGADQDKKGLFERAHGGTVFLDEVGDIPVSVQIKLLRVLQGGDILPLGSGTSRIIDVRIIAATNQDLTNLMNSGSFREDLYYRLNVIALNLPPLRKRGEDIPLLAGHFLKKISDRIGKKVEKMSVDFLHAFQEYPWPGNVRELENIIERAIVLSPGGTLTAKMLPPRILSAVFYSPALDESDITELTYKEAKKRALNLFNRSYIMDLLKKTEGNISAASEKAGMDRSNFKKIMHKYRVET